MCGTEGIVVVEVFPNFFTKCILFSLITLYGIDTSIKLC